MIHLLSFSAIFISTSKLSILYSIVLYYIDQLRLLKANKKIYFLIHPLIENEYRRLRCLDVLGRENIPNFSFFGITRCLFLVCGLLRDPLFTVSVKGPSTLIWNSLVDGAAGTFIIYLKIRFNFLLSSKPKVFRWRRIWPWCWLVVLYFVT